MTGLQEVRELPVIECIPYQRSYPCFALPLLACPESTSVRAVQEIDEVGEIISGFSLLDDYAAGDAISVSGPLAKIGERLIYCFITEDGGVHAGNVFSLESVLKAFINRCPDQTSVVLQILEIIGTDREKKILRARMRSEIMRTAGDRAARAFYERSTLRAALWQHLLASAPNAEAARRILRARPRLGASVDSTGNITLDLGELDARDRAWINQEQLMSSLMAEFDVAPGSAYGGELPHFDIKATNLIQAGEVSELMRRVKSTGRQEERIAMLADYVLQNREIGISILIQYGKDRANFANWAITELRTKLSNNNSSVLKAADEAVVANLVPRLFTKHYSLSRGELLFYLAKHLAKWPLINKALRRRLAKSRSLFVGNFRTRIDEILEQAEKPSGWPRS